MRKFFRNRKGAITVFITLLLIPSLLITGTGVDYARIHAAQSMVHNANQLAANALLSSYDTLLKDLYGLYGVLDKDEKLAEMVDRYIKATLMLDGDGKADSDSIGFNFFGASTVESTSPGAGSPLSEVDILRRQIEEYSKYRAPVIIASGILDKLLDKNGGFSKIQGDSEAIETKVGIEEKLAEIIEQYRELYKRIIYNDNTYLPLDGAIMSDIEYHINAVKLLFDGDPYADVPDNEWYEEPLDTLYENWDEKKEELDEIDERLENYEVEEGGEKSPSQIDDENAAKTLEEEMDKIKECFNERAGNISIFADELQELLSNYSRAPHMINYYMEASACCLDSLKDNAEKLYNKSVELDRNTDEIRREIEKLREQIESGECSEEFGKRLEESISEYEELIKYVTEPMTRQINPNSKYIEDFQVGLNTVNLEGYGLEEIENIPEKIENIDEDSDSDAINMIIELSNIDYEFVYYDTYENISSDNWVYFKNITSNDAPAFYSVLKEWFDGGKYEESKEKEQEIKDGLNNFIQAENQKASSGNSGEEDPENKRGAENIPDNIYQMLPGNSVSDLSVPNIDKSSANADEARESSISNMAGIGDFFGDFLSSAGNKILLLTYGTEMFSNFTTGMPDPSIKEEEEKKESAEISRTAMSNHRLEPALNYLYRSEQEYLFNGNKASGGNLAAVSGLIFAVRFVFNYISTFMLSDVKNVLATIKATVNFPPGLGLVLSELARVVWAAAESAVDLTLLLTNNKVPLMKTKNKEWKTSLSGFIEGLAEATGSDAGGEDDGLSISYSDYLRVFMFFVSDDAIAKRISDLVALNLTNKYKELNADETAMSNTELFPMDKAFTNFSVTTKIEVRYLFFSLPYAQGGKWVGVIPSQTFSLDLTDYRGY